MAVDVAEVFELGYRAVGDELVRDGENAEAVNDGRMVLCEVFGDGFAEATEADAVFDSDDAAVVGGGDLI